MVANSLGPQKEDCDRWERERMRSSKSCFDWPIRLRSNVAVSEWEAEGLASPSGWRRCSTCLRSYFRIIVYFQSGGTGTARVLAHACLGWDPRVGCCELGIQTTHRDVAGTTCNKGRSTDRLQRTTSPSTDGSDRLLASFEYGTQAARPQSSRPGVRDFLHAYEEENRTILLAQFETMRKAHSGRCEGPFGLGGPRLRFECPLR